MPAVECLPAWGGMKWTREKCGENGREGGRKQKIRETGEEETAAQGGGGK